MRVAIDAMGGDHAPAELVAGAIEAVSGGHIEVALVGDEASIRAELDSRGGCPDGDAVY